MMPMFRRPAGRLFVFLISLALAEVFSVPGDALAPPLDPKHNSPAPTLCQISDYVYRADGQPAQGTVLLSWPAFTTADGQAVTPGSLLVTLDASGGFNASLAPNTGAQPAGTFYRAIFKLEGGAEETEYWVVPNTTTTTIGAIRSKIVPSNQAAQFLTRDFADSYYVGLASTQTITGAKTFNASPGVPAPQNPTDAANKAYVDANSGGNLASPPPIGNVTPNSVTATTLTAQNANGTLNAAAFAGGDWSVATNAAIAAAPGGATIDMRGFSAAQLAVAGSATLQLSKPVHLLLPSGKLIFNGSPGISVTSYEPVMVEGSGWEYNYTPGGGAVGTMLVSGTGAPLVVDNTSQGSQWKGLELNCNNLGTIGYFGLSNGTVFDNVHVHGCVYAGLIAPGGMVYFAGHIMANNNGGDGIVAAADLDTEGEHQSYGNGGSGYHFFAGSGRVLHAVAGSNGLHGIYADGRVPPDWTANTTFISPSLIKPASGNPGGYYFYSLNVNGKTGTAAPSWCQSVGCMVTDGSAVWINLSTLNGGKAPAVGIAQAINLIGAQSGNNGLAAIAGFTADNIRYEGAATGNRSCAWNTISTAYVTEASQTAAPATGVHLLNCEYMTVDGVIWVGAGSNPATLPADQGGLIVENSEEININNVSCTWSTRSCVKLLNAVNTQLTNVTSAGTGTNTTEAPNNYAVQIDAASGPTQISNLLVSIWHDNEKGVYNLGALTYLDNYSVFPSSYGSSLDTMNNAVLTNAHGRQSNVPVEFDVAGTPALTIDAGANVAVPNALTYQNVPGVEYHVSKYASLQAAINAAYNNGSVLGTVVDDRTSPYSGPGFILYDSVTLKLAPTTYTITGTVTYNNGHNNVTAGIVSLPGARLIGASTSSNHGTIVTAANGLNADLIATSTVGTGIGASAQWWHWGGFENLRVLGNSTHQTAGNCFNIENMGEVAFLRTIEVSGCYQDNILFTGASATPSDIANITTNSAGRYGFNFDKLSGVAVVRGLSGDSNTTSLVRLNGGQSGTLTVVGFKAEEEISGQDPLITIDQTGQNGAQPSLFVVGGYTFGRSGVQDFIKYVNGTAGSAPYISVSNFYVQDYVNAVNDTVNGRTTAAANMNKVPFYYGPTGAFYSGQAYTLDLNTFVQSPHSGNGILTEILGTTSSNETLLAASGTSTSLTTGGIGFRMPNRTTYGQSPELFAKMTYAFPGGIPNNQQWEFIPAKVAPDTSTRWLGDPSYRWDEVYAADVNSNTATVGALNVTSCAGCGSHIVAGTMQGAGATLTGNSADQAVFTATLPAGTFGVGTGAHCWAKWQHTATTSTAITYKWTLGTTTWAYAALTNGSNNVTSDLELLTVSSLASELANLSLLIGGGSVMAGPQNGNTGAENLANASTVKLTFNAGSGEQVKGTSFYCQTVQ